MSAPTEIWWCEIFAKGWEEGLLEPCDHGYDTACGPRLVVDPAALVLLRDEEGNWPVEARRIIGKWIESYPWSEHVLLERLAAASQESL